MDACDGMHPKTIDRTLYMAERQIEKLQQFRSVKKKKKKKKVFKAIISYTEKGMENQKVETRRLEEQKRNRKSKRKKKERDR